MQGLSSDLKQFFLAKNNLFASIHNDTDDADATDNADTTDNGDDANKYNWVIGIALVKAFSCAKILMLIKC